MFPRARLRLKFMQNKPQQINLMLYTYYHYINLEDCPAMEKGKYPFQ